MIFYIATKLENHENHNRLRDYLLGLGHQISYDWTNHGSVQGEGDARIAEVAAMQGVQDASVVIVLLPGGRGTHVELGAAWASSRRIFIHGPRAAEDGRECAFYHSPGVTETTYGPTITHHEGSLAELALDVQGWVQEGMA